MKTKWTEKQIHVMYDAELLCLRLHNINRFILKKNCCRWDLSKNRKDSMDGKTPYVINT